MYCSISYYDRLRPLEASDVLDLYLVQRHKHDGDLPWLHLDFKTKVVNFTQETAPSSRCDPATDKECLRLKGKVCILLLPTGVCPAFDGQVSVASRLARQTDVLGVVPSFYPGNTLLYAEEPLWQI